MHHYVANLTPLLYRLDMLLKVTTLIIVFFLYTKLFAFFFNPHLHRLSFPSFPLSFCLYLFFFFLPFPFTFTIPHSRSSFHLFFFLSISFSLFLSFFLSFFDQLRPLISILSGANEEKRHDGSYSSSISSGQPNSVHKEDPEEGQLGQRRHTIFV